MESIGTPFVSGKKKTNNPVTTIHQEKKKKMYSQEKLCNDRSEEHFSPSNLVKEVDRNECAANINNSSNNRGHKRGICLETHSLKQNRRVKHNGIDSSKLLKDLQQHTNHK
ncbi:hypothetical protein H5410_006157 [Solanum commersonii]|uniref:Uncharacterized protein n=1 Tax=Solanum commersonii TaxID=4109 RepID=A0A9J6A9I8_SOLCO|nr:hypothetical protein H5410_006157 [Solanum commersonii]